METKKQYGLEEGWGKFHRCIRGCSYVGEGVGGAAIECSFGYKFHSEREESRESEIKSCSECGEKHVK